MALRLREAFVWWCGGVSALLIAAFWIHGRYEKQERERGAALESNVEEDRENQQITAFVHQRVVAAEEHGGMPAALAEALSGQIAANAAQIAALYESWGRNNGVAAVSDALLMRSEMQNMDALVAAFGGWMMVDRKSALDWTENAPMGLWRRTQCTRAVLRALPETDIEARGSWVARFPEDPNLMSEFALSWSAWEPETASHWLVQLADGKGKFAALSAVLRRWADDDPDAASGFIVDLPAGDSRDHAIGAFVEAIAELDPDAASVWVRTIENSAIRERASALVGIDELAGELISAPKPPHVSRKPGR